MNSTLIAAPAILAFAFSASPTSAANPYNFTPLAGQVSILDHTDGTGTNARFFSPTAVAVDASGNVYVADGGDHTIRKVTPGGVSSILAGSSGSPGSSDGTGTGARFDYPFALAIDAGGNLYVTDILDNTIRKVTAGGTVSTIAGTAGVTGSLDGTGSAARFNGPQGVAVDGSGNVYVSDTNNSTLRKVSPAGVVTTLAGNPGQNGASDGTGNGALFNFPGGIATDAAGNIYVADFDNSTIRKVTPAGAVSTFAGSNGLTGILDGTGGAARFDHPNGVAVDAAGNVYVMDTSSQTIRKITAAAAVTTLAGMPDTIGKADGAGAAARFFYADGIAVSQSGGSIYVADTGNHAIRSATATGSVTTLAGGAGVQGSLNGAASSATFLFPDGVAVDGSGNVYVADQGNNLIRKISGGSVSTLAGTLLPGSANGAGSAASFRSPNGVAVDGAGNVYVADTGNSVIRKISSAGTVSTLAGSVGNSGSGDGTGVSASFNSPQGLAVDAAGNVYVADTNNNTIRKITPAGVVTTLAGAGGQSGSSDGTGGGARFNHPSAVAVDGSGTLYVADFSNYTIRKVTSTGTVTTLAGLAGQPGVADGAGAAARFNQTYGIAVDSSGNVDVTDTYNRVVRQITASGQVSTIAGTMARFYYPEGIAVDGSGNLYVADSDNQGISEGVQVIPPPPSSLANHTVAPGGTATFAILSPDASASYQWQLSTNNGATWTNVANGGVYSGATTSNLTVAGAPPGLTGTEYRAQATNASGTTTSPAGTLFVGTVRLLNLSTRGVVNTGTNDLVGGFTISGTGTKQILLRGIGPALSSFGVTGVLATPTLTLFSSAGAVTNTNTGWANNPVLANAAAAVFAFALPANSADCAMLVSLGSGVHTAQVDGVGGTTGIGMAEIYDADTGTPTARLTNISARAPVGTGTNTLVGGFIIGGNTSETILIRGVGPGLAQFGFPNVLSNVQLTLYDSSSNVLQSNNGWGGSATLSAAFAEVSAFALQTGSMDSAMIVTLPPGSYSAIASGVGAATGTALLEIYEVP